MVKPILLVRIPHGARDSMSLASQKDMLLIIKDSTPDYNNLVLFTSDVDSVQFEVLNVQDYDQIDFEELKNKLEKYL